RSFNAPSNSSRWFLERVSMAITRFSVGASRPAPLRGVRQHKQVQTSEKLKDECEHRQEAWPVRVLLLYHRDEIDDNGQDKGNRQPPVSLGNPFVPAALGGDDWRLLQGRFHGVHFS